MPAPITAPIASMTRSPAPSTRLSDCDVPSPARSSAIGLRAKMVDICAASLPEAIDAVARRDNELTRRAEREADQPRAGGHERAAFDVDAVDACRSGERFDDVQRARGVERQALRPAERLPDGLH